jgi:hypothetical protein
MMNPGLELWFGDWSWEDEYEDDWEESWSSLLFAQSFSLDDFLVA